MEAPSLAARGNAHFWDREIGAVVDLGINRVNRARQAGHRPLYGDEGVVKVDWCLRAVEGLNAGAPAEPCAAEHFKQFEDAVALGLYDYMRKSGTDGFTISLSGGADSSACLALVYVMAKKVAALPKLPTRIEALLGDARNDPRAIMSRVCVCAYQGTGNSSEATRSAARHLAEQAGARFVDIDVQVLVDRYEAILSEFLERDLTWERDDIARQNIQARSRAPGIWAIANASNHLLLSTSNRSEAAVGYCTMDGDTAGVWPRSPGSIRSFSASGLWAEREHLSELVHVNALTPTAELRPESAHQSDEEDLMPYQTLNRMQEARRRAQKGARGDIRVPRG